MRKALAALVLAFLAACQGPIDFQFQLPIGGGGGSQPAEDILLTFQPDRITVPAGGEGSTTLVLWIKDGHRGRVRAFVHEVLNISGGEYVLPPEALRLAGNEVDTNGSWTYWLPVRVGLPPDAQKGRYLLFWGVEVLEGPLLSGRINAQTLEVVVP